MTYGIRGGVGTSAYYTQPQPFDELKLKPEQIQKKTAKLVEKGYFTFPIAEPTRRFLHQQSSLSNPAWRQETVGKVIDLKATDYERSTTAVGRKLQPLSPGSNNNWGLMSSNCEGPKIRAQTNGIRIRSRKRSSASPLSRGAAPNT
ncbi:Type III effector HopAZ1 [Pseudomonas syringae pv. cerasicola]|uniref:Type III effector HopAZ1 n=2 Tax=Pseudomonas syringae group TaxID=136849 RepID=A0A0P9P790_PSESX|nr:Type III effector HopAZ1 [Pseudomonas syringae pv. cerasicola]RMS78758.1 Type III effector HopAZ1 [Pseudomonas savastanoi]RMS80563.1 Type III effector HopAZ1 [Pseudomonas savastanoi]RMT52615.1 Type III effector HopAZ1 [Pseudomonas savastanoi]